MDDEEYEFDPVKASEYLRGAEWNWARWTEKPAVRYDAETGEESAAVWDHDHCHFCYQNAFSERGEDDLREGWVHWGSLGIPIPPKDQSAKYPVYRFADDEPLYDTWVCPGCFERLRERFDWVVAKGEYRP